jgi:phage terminase large subunit
LSALPTLASSYAAAARERIRRLLWLRQHPQKLPGLKRYYQTHISDFINDFGVTVDPRNAGTDVPVVMPFILDPKQREWVEFTIQNWRDNEYGLTQKSRDCGLSWLLVAVSISICVLFENVAIGWGSFKKEKLDFRGEMGSLFEKGRAYLDGLPLEFRAGYDPKTCDFERRLLFPHTHGSIIGDIGDEIGRGGRTTLYFVDEAAHLEHDLMADAGLSKNTKCRQDVSSVRGMNNTFAQRAHRAGIRKFTFHWRDNPRFSQADYAKFLELWGPVITAQELDINYQASLEGLLIQPAWVNAAIDAHIKLNIKVTGERVIALDVADQGIDKNAIAVRHGILLQHVEEFSGKDSDPFATTEWAFLCCDKYQARTLIYDATGIGGSVRGDGRKLNEQREAYARVSLKPFVAGGKVLDPQGEMVEGRKNEDMFLNFKAQAYWSFAMRLQHTYRAVTESGFKYDPDFLVSISSAIPALSKLSIQLCQPTHSQNSAGKVFVDKSPEGSPSPDMSDACMMCVAPRTKPMRIADAALEEFGT